MRGAGPSPPRRRHITAPNYRWRSHHHRDRLSTPAAAPPATTLCHPGRLFSADGRRRLRISIGGDLAAIAAIPPPHLSLPFPCISCLAVCVCGYPGLPAPTHAALGMRACCVRRSGCRREGLQAVLTAVSAYKNREKCCPDCAARCVWNVQSTRQHPFSHTPSPWTHTHVDTLHAHAQPVSQKVLLVREGKGSRVGEGS
eukprot:SAG25_NODE_154_length_13563_cov_44.588978_19_plen_199_part_00